MTIRILSMGFSAMMMVGLLGGCGEAPPHNNPKECNDFSSSQEDFDEDGLVGEADVCPFTNGDIAHRGCLATPQIGEACFGGYYIVVPNSIAKVSHPKGYPSGWCSFPEYLEPNETALVCQPDPLDGLTIVSTGNVGGYPTLPHKGVLTKATFPIAEYIRSDKPGAVLTWTKWDGATGRLPPLPENTNSLRYSILVPSDGTLMKIEDGDPMNSLKISWVMSPTLRIDIPCTDRNASGGPLCRF